MAGTIGDSSPACAEPDSHYTTSQHNLDAFYISHRSNVSFDFRLRYNGDTPLFSVLPRSQAASKHLPLLSASHVCLGFIEICGHLRGRRWIMWYLIVGKSLSCILSKAEMDRRAVQRWHHLWI